jgi:hypothetical protein
MACPYFLPKQRIGHAGWNPAPRLPLGDAWTGTCQAPPVGPFEPREETVREFCNYGYARGRCPHFPAQSEFDAVRFSSNTTEGHPLRIIYIREKDGAPVEHGEWRDNMDNAILSAQGRAFMECYHVRSQVANNESNLESPITRSAL